MNDVAVDVHAHCIPQDLIAVMRSEGPQIGVEFDDSGALIAGRVRTMPLRGELTDLGMRLESMDRSLVAVQWISSWIDLSAYELEPERGALWARRVNEALANEAARHPDRLRALATVPLQAPEAAAAELAYSTKELGMVGVEVGTTVAGRDLVSSGLEPFWAEAARLRTMVLLHPMARLAGVDLSSHFLDNSLGRPAETTFAVARLIMSGVFEHHPELRVCVVHGGGYLPFQAGRLQRSFEAVPRLAARDVGTPPLEAVRSLYYDTILHSPLALRFLIDLVGAERVLLGSDYPFEMGDPDPVRTVDRIPGLTEEERAAILAGNARRLQGEIISN